MYIKLPGCHRNILCIVNLDVSVTELFNSSIDSKKKKTIVFRDKNRSGYIGERVYGGPFNQSLLGLGHSDAEQN